MDHGRRVIRRPARFSGFAEKPPRTVKRKEVIDERNGRYAQENVCEVARRHSGRRVGKSNRVLLGGPGTTDWLVFTSSFEGRKSFSPTTRLGGGSFFCRSRSFQNICGVYCEPQKNSK